MPTIKTPWHRRRCEKRDGYVPHSQHKVGNEGSWSFELVARLQLKGRAGPRGESVGALVPMRAAVREDSAFAQSLFMCCSELVCNILASCSHMAAPWNMMCLGGVHVDTAGQHMTLGD